MIASVALHAGVFGLALLASALAVPDQNSLYTQVIGPHWHQLVWYSFAHVRISPGEQEEQALRRAAFRYDTHIVVSNPKQGELGTQRIHHPSPPGELQPRFASPASLTFRPPLETSSGLPITTESTPGMQKAPDRKIGPRASDCCDFMSVAIPSITEGRTTNLTDLPYSSVAIANLDVDQLATGLEPSVRGGLPKGPVPDDTRPSPDCLPGFRAIVPHLRVRDCSTPRTQVAGLIAITKAAPTSPEILAAAARAMSTQHSPVASEIQIVLPSDSPLEGRDVYSLAVQMPNVTSYSGSWLMWFAEHDPLGPAQELQPPAPLHKVDPQYSQSAISDGVQGHVVLAGVLQTNGRIRQIRILRGIDARLDLSAVRALLKWEFIAAQRNGVPVEMDMVAVIPFLLSTHRRH